MSRILGDRYEVGRCIAVGGMAEVFEAYDRRLGRPVAIKILRSDLPDQRARERFEREARMSARFNHPNAVTSFDVGEDGARPYLVMELVEGRDLARELAESGPLDPERAVTVMDAVLCALAAAHALGIVHRDVKPANILLGADGRVRLADFGIAKAIADAAAGLTSPGQVVGTARYLAPEQIRGEQATPRSDVYAAGIVLYESLVGQAPFADDTMIAGLARDGHDEVAPLAARRPDLPPGIVAVVDRALCRDPSRRFPDAESMRRALLNREHDATTTALLAPTTLRPAEPVSGSRAPALSDSTVASPASVQPRSPRARRRAWVGATLAAAGVLLALLVAGLSRARHDDHRSTPTTAASLAATTGAVAPATSATTAGTTTSTIRPSTTAPSTTPPSTTRPSNANTTNVPALPTTLDGLIVFLSRSPAAYGPRGATLLAQLQEIQSINPRKKGGRSRRDAATTTIDNIDNWLRDGSLAPAVAHQAQALLQPLTT